MAWVAVAAALAGGMMAAGAEAAPATSRSASAFWQVGDAVNTNVSLQVVEPAAGREGGTAFVFVTQRWCDSAADQVVFRSYSNPAAALAATELRIRPNLGAATLNATVALAVSEQRVSSCASPTGVPTTTQLGTVSADVEVAWSATGDRFEVQPGIVARPAQATGSLGGIASLGVSQAAEIRASSL